MRFQDLTAASMEFRLVFWDVMPCKIVVDRRFRDTCCLIMEAALKFIISKTFTVTTCPRTRRIVAIAAPYTELHPK
jgi:hypothetical protein